MAGFDFFSDDGNFKKIFYLRDDVEFGNFIQPVFGLRDFVEDFFVIGNQVFYGSCPVAHQSFTLAFVSRGDASAVGVPANDDVFHSQVVYGIFKYRKEIHVGYGNQVCNVAMNKKFARLHLHKGVYGNSAVGTAENKVWGFLAFGEPFKETRVVGFFCFDPIAVVL